MPPTPAAKILLNCAIDLFENGAERDSLPIFRQLADASERYIGDQKLPQPYRRAAGMAIESTQ